MPDDVQDRDESAVPPEPDDRDDSIPPPEAETGAEAEASPEPEADAEPEPTPEPAPPDDEGDEDEEDGASGETATFVEHLDELRSRIIRCVCYLLIGASGAFILIRDFVIDLLLNPIRNILKDDPDSGIIATKPAEWFFIWCKILLIAGLVSAIPLILWEIYGFVAPALTRKEKAYARWGFLFAPLLFSAGVVFAYIVIPFGLRFLHAFTTQSEVRWLISAGEYLSFFLTISLGLGLVFQMPLIVAVLSKIGILSSHFLASKRRYAVVILAIIAAIITPTPDVVNLSIVMVPMLVLFEISIIIARFTTRDEGPREKRTWGRKKRKRGRRRKAKEPTDEPQAIPPPEDSVPAEEPPADEPEATTDAEGEDQPASEGEQDTGEIPPD